MSFQATDDLLVRGVAAARDDDREQARYWLEWVLNDYPTPGQQATACYWLSRIAESPAEQRRYLEQALSVDPVHPEARRDLALLDGRLRPEEIIDPNQPLAPLTLDNQTAPAARQSARCQRCGGALRFSVDQQVLACQFCGYQATAGATAPVMEQDWFATAHSARGHRWVLASLLTVTCQTCGATRTLPAGQVSGTCTFCASPHLVQTEVERDLLEPDGIVPFTVDEAAARARLQQWRGRQRRPLAMTSPVPIYLPFWTFDVDGEIQWQAEQQQGFFTVPVRGSDRLFFDDILVPATQSLPTKLLTALRFNTKTALPYTDELLAGWPAELYRVPVTQASLEARVQAQARCQQHVRARPDADKSTLTITGTTLSISTYKLLLLPVWVATQQADTALQPILINGQSGELQAEGSDNLLGRVLAWLRDDDDER